ncbi:class I SAM-dependent methyltransferase [Alkanindiges illinoisensis]|uniref:class I SAM-dependent methyltransferase n=1 Tax=Alkanindiges illinoisensis TaxID=197183 RepID=UPI000550F0FC|nr:class I SAM-dependent methyltransferase [Alkanindiges illinoisensis]
MTPNLDVVSPIDLRQMSDAKAWADSALQKRPARTDFFNSFTTIILNYPISNPRILELDSGPGFLAQHLLDNILASEYVALDFSAAMHQLAQERLGANADKVQFIERSFKDDNWTAGLGKFDVIVTMQAVHELRHKRHAVNLFKQVQQVLKPDGIFLVCDHYVGTDAHGIQGMQNDQLYMTIEEQYAALQQAGFSHINQLLLRQGMLLHQAKL